jgi:hypothetical protein
MSLQLKNLLLIPVLMLSGSGLLHAAVEPDTIVVDSVEGTSPELFGTWNLSRRHIFDRSEAGKVIQRTEYRVADTWVEKERAITLFDSEVRDTHMVLMELDIGSGTWDTVLEKSTQYIGEGVVEKQVTRPAGTTETRHTSTYDANDSVAQITHMTKNADGDYVETGKTTYDRSSDDTVTVSKYSIDGAVSELWSLQVLAHNADGRVVYDSIAFKMGGDLEPGTVTTYAYDADGTIEELISRVFALDVTYRSTYRYVGSAVADRGLPRSRMSARAQSATAYTLSGRRIAGISRARSDVNVAGATLSAGAYVVRHAGANGETDCRSSIVSHGR